VTDPLTFLGGVLLVAAILLLLLTVNLFFRRGSY
jgi:hypothetical protein